MKIKLLFLSLALLAIGGSLQAAPAITVSASAVTLLGTTQQISITVTLIDPNNTGMLKVSGTGIVPIMRASTVTPGTTATVGPIYGNDVILDGYGNPNTTYYQVQVFIYTAPFVSSTPSLSNFYAFTGSGTVDLATATPLAPSFMSGPGGSVVMPGSLTVSGTGTFTGLLQCKNLENIRCIDPTNSQGWAGTDLAGWVASAFAALPQQSGTVLVTGGASYATPSASITVGVSPCVNAPSNGWSQTLIFDNVQITINNPIKVLCGGGLTSNGSNAFGSWITAGASLGTNPMIDIGDGTNGNINVNVSNLRLNCNLQAGCTGIRARGIQDLSLISYNQVQNYLVNGMNVDCSTAAGGGNFTLRGNFLAAGTGAADAMVLTSCNGALVEKNSGVSNSGVAITGASLKILSANSDQEPIIVVNNHSEKHTDDVLVDTAANVILSGIDVSNGTTNTLHVKSTATGSVVAYGTHSNANNTNPIVLNDVTTTNIASTQTNGMVLEYKWLNGQYEYWTDTNGIHWSPNSSGQAMASFGIIRGPFYNDVNSTANAATGLYRLASGDTVSWRNNANSADIALSKTSGDVLQYNGINVAQVIPATSAAFATATTAGTCVQNTTAVAGATTSMAVSISPVSTPGVGAQWSAFVSSAGNVTINECAVATSAGGTIAFNIRVIP